MLKIEFMLTQQVDLHPSWIRVNDFLSHKCDTEGRKSFKYTISLYTKLKNMQNSCGAKNQDGVTKRLVATRRRHKRGLWRADNFMFLNLSAGYMNVLTS